MFSLRHACRVCFFLVPVSFVFDTTLAVFRFFLNMATPNLHFILGKATLFSREDETALRFKPVLEGLFNNYNTEKN